tara:strand:- start:68 stop:2347 length:2280 start_codon:yes stop_codon:yes gene_type:complete
MAKAKSNFEYWNGSAWVKAVTPASNSALLDLTMTEKMGQPVGLEARILNRAPNAFSADAAKYAGNLSGVFTDFQRVRVIEKDTYVILFYGRIYSIEEKHDFQYGNVILLECFDAMQELKDNVTDGYPDISIDKDLGDTYPTLADQTETVDRRSGIIQALISFTTRSGNIDLTADANRFDPSARKLTEATTNAKLNIYKLKESNNKSALAHILSLSKDEPQTEDTGNTAGRFSPTTGYDFYVSPNFTSTGAQTPAAYFNYFKRGTRPYTSAENHGLRIEFPTGGGLTSSGRILPMMSDYNFRYPKQELFTEAAVHYVDHGPPTHAGSDYKKGMGGKERTIRMELIKIKTIVNGNNFVWLGKGLAGGTIGTDSAEYLNISGTNNVAKIQYISASTGGSDEDPKYALISDVTGSFPTSAGTEVTGASSSATFQLVSRLKEDWGIVKVARLGTGNSNNADMIREEAVGRLKRSSDVIVRGMVRVYNKPYYYVDSTSTTMNVSSGVTTVTFAGGFNPLNYGFRIGMTINKVNASTGAVESYGYASGVTSTTVVATMTASLSNSDKIRLYIPVRASDEVYVVNRLSKVTGADYIVTELMYTEANGVLNTEFSIVGRTTGLGAPQSVVAAAANAMGEQNRLDILGDNYNHIIPRFSGAINKGLTNGSSTGNGISWTAGTLTVGPDTYSISAGESLSVDADNKWRHIVFEEANSTTALASIFSGSVGSYYESRELVVLAYWRRTDASSPYDASDVEFTTLYQQISDP